MASEIISEAERKKSSFARVKSLRAALNYVARPMFPHAFYQHYTTLENLLLKISKGEWWLSCCTSDRLNDQKESVKYGCIKDARTLYQTCFSHSAAESVAMWGLYVCSKPCAIRITLPRDGMRKWIKSLMAEVGQNRRFARVLLRDLVYLAVKDPWAKSDQYDILRAECVSWEGIVTSKIAGLQDDITENWVTGLVKDSEWRHERESRLLIKMAKTNGKGIKINIPDDVLESMRFTYSPWLKPQMEKLVEKMILSALTKKLKREPRKLAQRFRRSSLSGGLNIGDGRVPCASCDSCRLFGHNICMG